MELVSFSTPPSFIFRHCLFVLFLLYGQKGGDNIGHNAHFWGATFGLAFAFISASILKPEFIQYFIGKLMEGPSWPTFLQ